VNKLQPGAPRNDPGTDRMFSGEDGDERAPAFTGLAFTGPAFTGLAFTGAAFTGADEPVSVSAHRSRVLAGFALQD